MTTEKIAAANSRQVKAWNGDVGTHWAAHHGRFDTMLGGLNDTLFEAAAIGAGDRVLDIGCGAGGTTRVAARRAAHGHAVGVDISAPLLDVARARTAADGIPNAAYELADAQVHAFPAAAYDVAISRGGVMFFADHAAAFENIGRALRPGGRLVFVCPQPVGETEKAEEAEEAEQAAETSEASQEARALALFGKLLEDEAGPGEQPSADALATRAAMASLSDPDRIHEALAAYKDVTVTPVSIEAVWGETPRDAVDFMLSRTPGRAVAPEARAALEDVFRPYATESGVRMRAGVWLVTAVRPS
ncbi:class I SAM-dependent methyltransferase [Streptomyces sp. NBC_01381]|uniref:class I SAM-dependent methyltransferase n=1 Tax=Streptomyces sp. NBC_01381 TaxID=2903845 RepID=UPI00224E019D|nr:class I SAM-dependent methyltransferase [Streptomyces sp. NBC_01381]MCX4671254.1 class I SAM-dependent methyltransferase [Streptomyces sp. NBC_01381]